MSKTLRTAALVVGAVALVATGIGAAGAGGLLGSSIAAGGTIAGVGTAAAFTSFGALASVGAFALTIAATATAKKPYATGSPEQFKADPEGFVPYLIGRTATGGNIVFRRAWDTSDKGDNDRQSFVVALSIGPVEQIEIFAVDKATVSFNGAGQASGGFSGFMWQTTQLGACPEGAALGFGTGAGSPPSWGSTRKLSGLAAATWTLRFDTKAKLYQNGVPTPRWVVKGAKAYDPRLDSTYPGGSGAHRANNEATWAYTENPFLHGLTWLLGRHQNGVRVIGVGAPLGQIDVASYVEGANIADLNGWKVGGVIYSGDNKWDALKRILQAGVGEPLQLGAQISCFVNAPKVSLATIGVGDVVGDASVTATQPRRDRINGVVPRYRQEANDWQLLPGTAVRVSAYETVDGGRRTKEVDYAYIQQDAQAAVAARYDIENAREFGPITLPLKLRWIGFKPGDVVTANLPELGLASQPILLLNRDFDPAAGVPTFTARSETNGKHAFALGQTSTPPPTPGVSVKPEVPIPGDTAWTITATQLSTDSSPVPALVVEGAIDSPVAEAIVAEYRVQASGQADDEGWIGAGLLPPETTRIEITSVRPSTAYEVAISYRRRGVTGERLILGPETTGEGATRTVPTGAYDNGRTYQAGDVTTDQGSSWIWINATPGSGHPPPALPTTANSWWTLLAQAGQDGSGGGGGVSYPPASLTGAGSFTYPFPVSLAAGEAVSASAYMNINATGSSSITVTIAAQISVSGASSWTTFGSANASSIPGEPSSVELLQESCTFTNGSGATKLYDLRFVVSKTGGAASYSDGFAQVYGPGGGSGGTDDGSWG